MSAKKLPPTDLEHRGEGRSSLTKSAINIVANTVLIIFSVGLFALALQGALALAGGCA